MGDPTRTPVESAFAADIPLNAVVQIETVGQDGRSYLLLTKPVLAEVVPMLVSARRFADQCAEGMLTTATAEALWQAEWIRREGEQLYLRVSAAPVVCRAATIIWQIAETL